MKHAIPLETVAHFEGDPTCVKISSYQEVLGPCDKDCTLDHDHYGEAYICVREESWTARPLSKLRLLFDPDTHMGRPPTLKELGQNHDQV